MKFADCRGIQSLATGLCLLALVLALPGVASAQGFATVGEERQRGASPTLRVIDQTPTSVTYEATASWDGRLRDARQESLGATVMQAVGGLPWLDQVLALPSLERPQVTVLSAEFDEVPLTFSAEAADAAGLTGRVAEVEHIGIERRQPTGTFVVRLLQADPDAGTLRRYTRVRVRIDFTETDSMAFGGALQNPHLDVSESVLATGTWYKIPVTREGIYRIDRSTLSALGLNPNTIDPHHVQVFGNDGAPVPALNSAPRIPDLAENPVFVVGGGDGRFNEADAVYFFARASTGWEWTPSSQAGLAIGWRHYINPFSTANYYFIRIDGTAQRRIATAPVPPGTPNIVERVVGRIFIEEDLPGGMIDRDGGGSGLDWLGRDLTRTRNQITVLDTIPPDLAQGTVSYRSRVAQRSDAQRSLSWLSGQETLATENMPASTSNVLFQARTRVFHAPVSAGERLRIDLRLNATSGNPTAWIDYIQALYPQDLRAHNDYLRFASPGGQAGVFEFVLRGFTGEPQVWDVSSVAGARRLSVTASGDTYRVRVLVEDRDHPAELVAFRTNSSRIRALNGASSNPVANQNLHGHVGHPEYVIVTARDFWDAANELAAYRSNELQTAVFDIQEIYNEFSGGQVDPRGLRDFIRFLYDRYPGGEPALRYVLLFGDGNYDYRGIRPGGLENNFIPTYQTENSSHYNASYTSDDYFGLLDPNEGEWASPSERLDLGIGRLPVRTPQEAADMVAKIKRYENPDTQGAWRTRYTLLSDDHLPNWWDRDLHVQNSEVIADTAAAWVPGLNFEKIYMATYTLQQTALGARYPGATADALRSLEEGTLIWNYSGHGGPSGLADEKLITREEIETLSNFDRLTIAITATCSFGRYDLAGERSGGEAFILNPNGGAVAIFTTSRVVYAGASPESETTLGLNIALNRNLLRLEDNGRPSRLGDAFFRTKQTNAGASVNGRKFNLLGDPAMRIGLPQRPVRITSINEVPIGDDGLFADVPETVLERAPNADRGPSLDRSNGERTTTRDRFVDQVADHRSGSGGMVELRAQELATIRGEVLGFDETFDPSYSGEVEVLVYDVERTFTLPAEVVLQHTDGTFQERSDLIYRGRASVQGGTWEAQFIVPRDISYAGTSARISAYVSSGTGYDGQGFTEEVVIGTESGPPLNDTQGPRVRMFLNDTTFVSGGLTGDEPVFIAKLSDESGINMAGVGVGHEMMLVINGNEAEAIDIGPFYRSDLDTFRSGSVRYPLPPLGQGPHSLTLTAWDVVNNSSTARLDFVVEDSNRLRIEHAYPYPNPTTGPTRFVFEHNQAPGTPARVQIRIYTISGRPIRTLDGHETLPEGILTGSPVQIPWDGRDEDFDELATGIYLYRVRVEVDQGDGERRVTERVERLAIIR